MVATSFLPTLLLALAVAAKPLEQRASESLVDLSFIKVVSGGNLFELDQLRAKLFKKLRIPFFFGPGIASSPADNRAVSYIATVGVGSPPTNCKRLQQLLAAYKFLRLFYLQTTLSLTREGERVCAATYVEFK